MFISLNLTGNPSRSWAWFDHVGFGYRPADPLDQVVTELGFGKYTTTTAGSTLNMFVPRCR